MQPLLSETVFIMDEKVSEYSDTYLRLLALGGQHSLLPELSRVFDKKEVLKFLDVFAGVQFTVPTREALFNAVRNADIYLCLANETDTVSGLARKYDIDQSTVVGVYKGTKELLRRAGIVKEVKDEDVRTERQA